MYSIAVSNSSGSSITFPILSSNNCRMYCTRIFPLIIQRLIFIHDLRVAPEIIFCQAGKRSLILLKAMVVTLRCLDTALPRLEADTFNITAADIDW